VLSRHSAERGDAGQDSIQLRVRISIAPEAEIVLLGDLPRVGLNQPVLLVAQSLLIALPYGVAQIDISGRFPISKSSR
jgi:hypothetical protein